jgi:hypothetical protein
VSGGSVERLSVDHLAVPVYPACHAIIIGDGSPEGTSMRDRYPHPSQQPLLPLTMVVSVLIGVLFLRVGGQHAKGGAGFAFAWFLVSFAPYGLAWLLRDHAEWRESRRRTSTIDAD